MATSRSDKNEITVTVLVFSGRPNPLWAISIEQYNALLLYLKNLSNISPQEPLALLGYSGCVINDQAKKVYAFDGIITLTDGRHQSAYADTHRQFEKKLLRTAPAELIDEIRGMLPAELK